MRRTFGLIAALTFGLLFSNPAGAKVTDEQVKKTIEMLVKRLYDLQRDNGTWDPDLAVGAKPPKDDKKPGAEPDEEADTPENAHIYGTNYGGMTALATYALITAGESYQHPKIRSAFEFLSSPKVKINGVYGIGIRNHVWSHLPARFEPNMRQDTLWLLDAMGGGPAKGGYHYTPAASKAGLYDNSVTQYGVLGVWEGVKRGMPVKDAYWAIIEKHFIATQMPDGGWSYIKGGPFPTTGSMTAAGLACLFIVRDYLYANDFKVPGKALDHPLQLRINKGIEWFDKNFTPVGSPYYMVGVERVGLASGYKYFKGQDWYATISEVLVRNPPQDIVNASFALIFLSRGRVPILINKLEVPDYHWNNRPRDLAELSLWVSDRVEQEMNWQVVGIGSRPEEWLDAPMLYISGHEPLNLTEEQAAKIKRYIDLGGMVITTADNNEAAFTKSVEELYTQLYPDLTLRSVTDSDELLQMVFPSKGNRLNVSSLHNGVRHLALHIPKDISWQLHSASRADTTVWQFMANAYYYATEKGRMRPRLSEHFTARAAGGGGPKIEVARVRHPGQWNPEPAAWEVQSNKMFNAKKADVSTKEIELHDLASSGVKFAHVVGTSAPTFSPEQVEAIKAYVNSGGVILFENIGGRGDFAAAAMKALSAAFPEQPMRPLNSQSPIISGQGYGGHDLTKVDYRAYTILRSGALDSPRLQAITFDGRPHILFSSDDLSFGMLDQPRWGVYGYSSDSAQKIVSNAVLWAHSQASASAPTP